MCPVLGGEGKGGSEREEVACVVFAIWMMCLTMCVLV